MTFTEYCKANNIKLLYDDLKFIRFHIGQLPQSQKKAVLKRYTVYWLTAMANEPIEALKQTMGRRAANKYLLELTE